MFDKAKARVIKDQVKNHVQEHRIAYWTGSLIVIAGITYLIMRNVSSQPISSSVTGTAGSSVTGTGKKVAISNISFISSNRQGVILGFVVLRLGIFLRRNLMLL